MMKAILLVSVILVTLVAACVQLPWGRQQVGTTSQVTIENPDISVKVSAFPSEVKGGRNISVTWNIINNQLTALKNVDVDVYDQCLFSGNNSMHFDNISANRNLLWNWHWSSQPTQFERDCEIKFKVSWDTSSMLSQDLTVLSDSEYFAREQADTLDELATMPIASNSPVTLSLVLSEPLPWTNSSIVYIYTDMADTGGGLMSKLLKDSVNITVPANLDPTTAFCDEYRLEGNVMVLNRDIEFINKEAPSLTCTFNTLTDRPIKTGTLSISANYKYELYDSFTIKVNVK